MENAANLDTRQDDRVYQVLIEQLQAEIKEINARMDARESAIEKTSAETRAIINQIKAVLNVKTAL